MKFGSVCSGIEAASVAFEPLGWKAAWFSEIEPFPCAVLKHHYPDTPNHGDMTTLPERIKSGEVDAPDLFCGGTPCQAFSVAGLRQSLSDDRGNLSLTFCEIANAIDDVRLARGEPPAIIFWENVPGVLSTTDNAFGCFLGALSGCDTPISPGRLGWTDAGVVTGPQRTVAWRVLDAQYFGLAQRRRRVFVVASARDGFNPAEVLLEFQGLRRDFAPSREAGARSPGCAPQGLGVGGELARALTAAHTATDRLDPNEATFVTHALRGEGFDASEDGTERGTPLVPVAFHPTQDPISSQDVCHAIGANENATAAIAFGFDGDVMKDGLMETITTREGAISDTAHAVMRPVSIQGNLIGRSAGGPQGVGVSQDGVMYTLTKMDVHGVSFTGGVDYENNGHDPDEPTGPLLKGSPTGGGRPLPAISLPSMQVRRLTPVECERLQGFPDGYTNIPWRGKPESPDGPRYKALGNSWAVPCVQWIGKRIQQEVQGKLPS